MSLLNQWQPTNQIDNSMRGIFAGVRHLENATSCNNQSVLCPNVAQLIGYLAERLPGFWLEGGAWFCELIFALYFS